VLANICVHLKYVMRRLGLRGVLAGGVRVGFGDTAIAVAAARTASGFRHGGRFCE